MQPIEWGNCLRVGDDHIDNDHRHLIAMANRLIAPEARTRTDLVLKVLDELIAYTQEHFGREEKYMEAVGFPGLVEHREKHRRLCERAVEYRRSMQNQPRLWHGDTLFAFLADWLLTHIANEDRKIGDHVRAHGLEEKGRAALAGSGLMPPASSLRHH